MSDKARARRKKDVMARVARVQAILRDWDPIGIRPGEDWPADEYDSYAFVIVAMVARGCSDDDLAAHLEEVRTKTIGVGADRSADRRYAARIRRTLMREFPDEVS